MDNLFLYGFIFLYLHYGVLGRPPCGEERNVSGIEGGNVTLPLDDTRITDISWVTAVKHIATTGPGKPLVIRDKLYQGRLNATVDGSLIIFNLSREDKRTYTANIQRNILGQCKQLYNLFIYVEKAYKLLSTQRSGTEDDSKRCERFLGCQPKPDYTTVNIVRLTLSACLLCITCCVFIHHMKSEIRNPSSDSG